MKETKNVPQLRFSGFDDEWEEKKLNEYLEPSKQKNLDNKYSKNDVLSVSGEFGIVNQIEFQGRSFAGEYVNNYGVVETNDIVYTKSPLNANPYGIIKSNFGKTGIVSTLYAVYKSKNNVDPCFIQTYFDLNKRLNDYLRPLVRKGCAVRKCSFSFKTWAAENRRVSFSCGFSHSSKDKEAGIS